MSQSGGSALSLELFIELLTQRVPVTLILKCVGQGLCDGADGSVLGEDHRRTLRTVAGQLYYLANELEADHAAAATQAGSPAPQGPEAPTGTGTNRQTKIRLINPNLNDMDCYTEEL